MKVEAVTIRELRMPLKYFFETSFGRTESRRVLLVTVHCEDVDGWAECVASDAPFFSYEWIETAWLTIREFLAPAIIGAKISQAREAAALMSRVRGHNMAKAALENALWDAEARQKQQPLWKLLGGTLNEIACGVSIGIQDSHDQLLDKIDTELHAGYQRIKVKVKPGWDLEVLSKIRERWPSILLSCDANSAYRPCDLEHLRKFDEFRLLMIEQPLWDDDINIKTGRVGGFSEAIAIHDLCQKHGIPVWCGGMLETGIGRAHNVALSTLPNFRLPGDVSASKRYWAEDIVAPEIEVSPQGTIPVQDVTGAGYEVKTELIQKLTVSGKVPAPEAAFVTPVTWR